MHLLFVGITSQVRINGVDYAVGGLTIADVPRSTLTELCHYFENPLSHKHTHTHTLLTFWGRLFHTQSNRTALHGAACIPKPHWAQVTFARVAQCVDLCGAHYIRSSGHRYMVAHALDSWTPIFPQSMHTIIITIRTVFAWHCIYHYNLIQHVIPSAHSHGSHT